MAIAEPRAELLRVLTPRRLAPNPGAGAALLRGLNREQRRAVTHMDGPALVVAGPGTGKTEVVTRRVAWLIATRRALPREILALTFTDNAAQEMQARVDVLVPYGQADAAIHTFHAFGDRLLREHAFELGLASNLRLLSRPELILFLREHLFDLGLERYRPLGDPTRFLGALVDLFGRAKDEDLSPAGLAQDAKRLRALASGAADEASRAELSDLSAARAEIAAAFEGYTQIMASRSYIDHSDQVALALRLLRSRPLIRAEIGRRFRFVLVDELQDTNKAQLELVLAVAGNHENVMAVGDPDQGIYGFRGARAGNVDHFRASFADAATIALRRNYRSLEPVIAAADRVLRTGSRDTSFSGGGQLSNRRGRGTAVRHVSFASPDAEADGVAAEIERRISSGRQASDFAVLVRSNSETGEFVRSLRVRGINADDGATARLRDVPVVRSLLAFLRVVADPSNSLEAFTLAADAPYGLGGDILARLLNGARRRNRSLLEALQDAADASDPGISEKTRKSVMLLLEHIRAGIDLAATNSSGEVLYDYLRRSGALRRLARADAVDESDARSLARFCELVRARSTLLAQDRVAFLVAGLELDGVDVERDASDDDRDAVKVLTIHRAKGLEFTTVFICGLVDGRFPVRSRPPALSLPVELVADPAADERALAEERRLFYVALTRARDEVILTSHEFGPHGRGRRRPSIFIAEAIDAPSVANSTPTTGSPVSEERIAHALLPVVPVDPAPAVGRPLTLSYSQIDEYLSCPERYRLRYDIGIPTPAHHALSYGTAIHQAIAAFHGAQARGVTLTEDELVDELRNAWQPDGYLSREHEDARFAAGADALRLFRAQQVATGAGAPDGVERPFNFRLGRDEIRGRIDRIDEQPDGAVITDYKSSDVRDQKRADAKARESLQLQVYALAHEARTGSLPKRVQLHFVESGVVGSAQPTPEGLAKARLKLGAAADAIRERKFVPKPSPITCGYCPFRTICQASAA